MNASLDRGGRGLLNAFLHVDRLEFSVTQQCNAHCKHCCLGDANRASPTVAIDQGLAVQITREVARAYSPRSIMTFGGEPLLFPDIVCAIHDVARAEGIPKRQVITNAGCPPSADAFREVARELAYSGVNEIALSVDGFHQEHVPVAVVEQNVRSLLDAGISQLTWNPCWLVSKEDDNAWNRSTRLVLESLAHLPVADSGGNTVQPMGRALRWLSDYLPPKMALPPGSCGDSPYTGTLDQVRSISVEPDGGVAVCTELLIGNASRDDILGILRDYNPYRIPEMRAILEGGVSGLARLATRQGIGAESEGYYSICDMCTSLRRRLVSLKQPGREGSQCPR